MDSPSGGAVMFGLPGGFDRRFGPGERAGVRGPQMLGRIGAPGSPAFGPGQQHFHSGLLPTLIGAWQINGISSFQKGMPVVISAPNQSGLPGLTSRAVRLHSGVLASGQTRDHWFDTTAFTSAQQYTLGSDSRTEPDLRAPGIRNFDVSIARNQLVRERINTQFRAEAFNLLNTPQLGAPDGSVTSPTFGRILTGSGNRVLQLGLRISF